MSNEINSMVATLHDTNRKKIIVANSSNTYSEKSMVANLPDTNRKKSMVANWDSFVH
jgi:hypothetical protein